MRAGGEAWQARRYAAAEEAYAAALQDAEALGAQDRRLPSTLLAMALVLEDQAQYRRAEPLLRRAVALREPGPTTPEGSEEELGILLANLGTNLIFQGRYAEAEPLLQRADATIEGVRGSPSELTLALRPSEQFLYGRRSVHLAQVRLARGYLALRDGRPIEAEAHLRGVVAIWERDGRGEPPGVALCWLGDARDLQQQSAETELLYRRGLRLAEKRPEPKDWWLGVCRLSLGRFLARQGRYPEAESLLQQALATRQRARGSRHPDVATAQRELGRLYTRQGRYGEAEPLLRGALAVHEQVLGVEHPEVADTLEACAALLRATGRDAEAAVMAERAAAIRSGRRQGAMENDSGAIRSAGGRPHDTRPADAG
jgi:tetratricopeptide (TPR) repeat protein